MGILDDARFLQSRKRTDRLLISKQKKIKGATYLGKDPVDGTDIVQPDGDDPTSGYRMISNKPISTGDRVSLRPSKSGLQRADARNVKPDDIADEVLAKEQLFIAAVVSNLIAFTFSGSSLVSEQKSGIFLLSVVPIVFTYSARGVFKKKEASFVNPELTTSLGIFPTTNNINPETATLEFNFIDDEVEQNNFTITTLEPLLDLPTQSPYAFLEINFIFPLPQFKEILSTLDVGTFTIATSPIEFESSVNGIAAGDIFNEVIIAKVLDSPTTVSSYTIKLLTETSIGAGSLTHKFDIKYRKRGNTQWFSLK